MCTLYFKRMCVHFLNMRSHFVFSISYLLRLMSHSSSTLSDILSILFFLMSLTNCFTFLTIQMNGRYWLAKKKLCSHVHRQNKNWLLWRWVRILVAYCHSLLLWSYPLFFFFQIKNIHFSSIHWTLLLFSLFFFLGIHESGQCNGYDWWWCEWLTRIKASRSVTVHPINSILLSCLFTSSILSLSFLSFFISAFLLTCLLWHAALLPSPLFLLSLCTSEHMIYPHSHL